MANASYSRFRVGDRVELRVKDVHADLSTRVSKGWRVELVEYPAPGKIEITISGHVPLESGRLRELYLFRDYTEMFSGLLIKKIRELGKSGNSCILGSGKLALQTANVEFNQLYEELNPSQKNAIKYLIDNDFSGAIQGPPGTGKTQLLRAVIALAVHSNMKVGITAFTHAAVDNLLGRVVTGKSNIYDWVRIAEPFQIKGDCYGAIEQSSISARFSKEINESHLFGATLHKFAHNAISAPRLDLLVIDEAGQVPVYFWPFVQRLARRVILVGDQFQLPPVLATKHASVPVDNIFSLAINDFTPMLETQYRMRREIQAWSAEKFYKGKLVPDANVAERVSFGHRAFFHDPVIVPKMFGNSELSEESYIAGKIKQLNDTSGQLDSVGVICPYRAQAGRVNAKLQETLGPEQASKVLVDTVERFQGQEREAIFLSFGSSDTSYGSLSFLSDPKRLNVSITRAKSRFYCLYDERLLKQSGHGHSYDLNEFLRWVVDGKTKIRRAI